MSGLKRLAWVPSVVWSFHVSTYRPMLWPGFACFVVALIFSNLDD